MTEDEERHLLASTAAHFAKALAHWRDLHFILEIAEERQREDLAVPSANITYRTRQEGE